MKTSITPTPTDLDKDLAKAIVNYRIMCDYALSERDDGFYTQEEYEQSIQYQLDKVTALIQAEIVKALETLLFQAREHTITDIEMIMHQTNGKVDFIEAVTTDQIIKYITALKEEI